MTTSTPSEIQEAVRDRYAAAARAVTAGEGAAGDPTFTNTLYGQQADEVPDSALAASLGCGNPTLLAQLSPGQTVLDLGSGGGLDVLLSARRVGPTGRVYGLDMTEEMLALARDNQRKAGITNAEFLIGTIEHLPLPDASVDVIISNCVINLSADKDAVFGEAHRVLRPGGRLAISDIALLHPLPPSAQQVMALWTGCVAGALVDSDYRARLQAAGFTDVEISPTQTFDRTTLETIMETQFPGLDLPAGIDVDTIISDLDGAIISAFVRGRKP